MKSGYNLLEILVVLVIIALIAGLVGNAVFGRLDTARSRTAEIQIRGLKDALDQFRLDVGRYPTEEEGLRALVQRPDERFAAQRWTGPYLDEGVPADPWGRPYHYEATGAAFDRPILLSYGSDGAPGGEGDAADVGFLPANGGT